MSDPAEPLRGSIDDPDFRQKRASKAGKAGHAPRAHINALIRNAGKLTPEDLDLLRGLLPAPQAAVEPSRRSA